MPTKLDALFDYLESIDPEWFDLHAHVSLDKSPEMKMTIIIDDINEQDFAFLAEDLNNEDS